MIHIVHVISGLELGGAEIMLANLIARGNRQALRHTVVSLTTRGDVGAQIEAAGVEVIALGMRRHRPNLLALKRLHTLMLRHKPDIVQTWLYHGDIAGTIAAVGARSPRLVWSVQCSSLDERSVPLRAAMKLLSIGSRIPDAIIVNSEAGIRAHEELGYRPRAWIKIPNGVDTEAFHPRTGERERLRAMLQSPPDAFAIGLVARFHPMKDHRTFIAAAASFARSRTEAVFVLVGAGAQGGETALARLVHTAGLSGRVVFLGPRTDLANVYPALDITTLSSAYGEGCPNVLLEAMACGIPTVATNVGDCAAIIGDTGRVVEPRDPTALCAAWMQVADADRIRLGSDARMRVDRFYSLRRIIANYEAFYFQLCSGAVPSSDSFSTPAVP